MAKTGVGNNGWTDERRAAHSAKMRAWWAGLSKEQQDEHARKSEQGTFKALSDKQKAARRSLNARIGAKTRWSKDNPRDAGIRSAEAAVRHGVERLRETYPELSDDELRRRVIAARDARLLEASKKSAELRKAK